MIAEFEKKNQQLWDEYVEKNQDPYGRACVEYASQWASLMEQGMEWGKASHATEIKGVTGFMYGCAAQMIAQCWTQGEEFRRWFNKREGVEEEIEGIVNPAILVIGTKETTVQPSLASSPD